MTRLGREFEDGRYPDYFAWLCEIVCVDGRYTDESYWVLAKRLWDTDFYWILDRDESRAKSVSILRYRYQCIGGTDIYKGPATVLEVLVTLAENINDILDELDDENRATMYFWEMIDNLGLSEFSDQFVDEGPENRLISKDEIDKRLENWMDRRIEYDGTGGLFPLNRPKEDQADVEIWYQMNAYIIENY